MTDDRFEAMVTAHHGEIRRYLLRCTAQAADADDLSQETFLRAYRARHSLAPDASVRAWLFAIATNLCRNHFRAGSRQRRAHAAAAEHPPPIEVSWPEGEALYAETRDRIEQVVVALPLKQRLAFVMRKLHDLDYAAIGRSLDCSPESARAHVFQALRKIRLGLDGLAPVRRESQG
jgi:RNA polymerase sigma-70 factor, ECF subfamily